MYPRYLVNTDVALVTEHHVIPFFTVRRATHIADDILVILNPEAFHRLDGVVYVVMALPLQGLHGALHCQLIDRLLPWKTDENEHLHSQRNLLRHPILMLSDALSDFTVQ